jgi:5-formyltetrahydrofolate cyclo-ligase
MNPPMHSAKTASRAQVRARLATLSPQECASQSQQICERALASALWSQARSILFFAPTFAGEPDITPLIQTAIASGKTVALPHFISAEAGYRAAIIASMDQLVVRQFNVREPGPECPEHPLNRLDLIFVPGVAFTARGERIGRGKGYYDRLLASVRGKSVGVAFEQQLIESLPVEPHDVLLNCILTPTRLIET